MAGTKWCPALEKNAQQNQGGETKCAGDGFIVEGLFRVFSLLRGLAVFSRALGFPACRGVLFRVSLVGLEPRTVAHLLPGSAHDAG